MTAPTAREVLRSLDRSRQAIQMQALSALDGAGEAEVRRALSAVKPSAKIDVPVLLESIRRGIAERAEAEAKYSGENAWRYELSLKGPTELLKLRDDLRTRVEAGEGDQPFEPGSAGALILSRIDGIASRLRAHGDDVVEEPDPDLDDDEDASPRRRSIPRTPSRRAGERTRSPALPAKPAAHGKQRVRTRPSGSLAGFLGPRLLGPGDPDRPYGASVDYSPSYSHFDPPWLLPDEEPDKEKDDVDTEPRVSA